MKNTTTTKDAKSVKPRKVAQSLAWPQPACTFASCALRGRALEERS